MFPPIDRAGLAPAGLGGYISSLAELRDAHLTLIEDETRVFVEEYLQDGEKQRSRARARGFDGGHEEKGYVRARCEIFPLITIMIHGAKRCPAFRWRPFPPFEPHR